MAIIQYQYRRDTAANWTSNNTVLAQGEPGYETDTGKFKIGDGTTAWTSLGYQPAAAASNTQIIFNDSNYANGSAGLTFIKTSNNLVVANSVNAASFTVGTSTTVNSTVINAASFIVGSATVVNATVVNAASHTIGSSLIANTLGLYHTGTINAASHTIGTTLVANTLGVYHTGTINAASHTIGTTLVANTLGVYHTGTINAASHSTGSFGSATGGVLIDSNTVEVGNSTANVVLSNNSIVISGSNTLTLGTASVGTANLANGYTRLTNGLLLQWFVVSATVNTTTSNVVSFPTTFTTNCFCVQLTPTSVTYQSPFVQAVNNSTVSIRAVNASAAAASTFHGMAIGA